jgi:transmembrane sensor
LSYLNRGRALGSAQSQSIRTPHISRRAFALGGALAAAAAGIVALAVLLPRAERYATAIGEVRKVPLSDGSMATINTASELKVAMTQDVRRLSLVRGEAWFKVAKNARRPFVVDVGHVRVSAVGTAFSVRRRDEGADVLVSEGLVEMWVEGPDSRHTRVPAGSRASVGPGQPVQVVAARDEIDKALAWRYGQISLYSKTLADAAMEFNRYNTRKIVISDPALASEKVVGEFSADDPEAFARAAAGMFGARVSADESTLRLYRDTPSH